jgi:hypothetical protein
LCKWHRLAQLLRQPGIGGIPGNTEVHQASRTQLNDDKHEHRLEEQIVCLEEITGPNSSGMVPQKGGPGLFGRPRFTRFTEVFLDRFWLTACQIHSSIQNQSMVSGLCPPAETLFDNRKKGMHVVTHEGKEWKVHRLPFESGIQAVILPQDEAV